MRAPAKINLALHVTGQRQDGYHTLDSLVAFAEIADTVAAAPAETDSFVCDGPFAAALAASGAPADNLVVRALAAYRGRAPLALPPGLAVRLTKRLPVAAGLGGGSADAAAVLMLLDRLAGAALTQADLAALARGLGADVPICLHGRAVRATGIGDLLAPVPPMPALAAVLANPRIPLRTPDVFAALTHRTHPGLPPIPAQWGNAEALCDWLRATRNDLEPAARALVPAIADITAEMAARPGCHLARMSGSGATVFGLFSDHAGAAAAAAALSALWPDYWIEATHIGG